MTQFMYCDDREREVKIEIVYSRYEAGEQENTLRALPWAGKLFYDKVYHHDNEKYWRDCDQEGLIAEQQVS